MNTTRTPLPIFLRLFLTLRQKMTKRNMIIAFLLLALLAAATAMAALNKPAAAPAIQINTSQPAKPVARVLPVRTVPAQLVNGYDAPRHYTGRIEARRSGDLGFERGGRVLFVHVEEGDVVEREAPLATLDTRLLKNTRRKLKAKHAQAQAVLDEMLAGPRKETIRAQRAAVAQLTHQIALSRQQHERRADLLSRSAISQEEFDQYESEIRVLEARHDGAQSRLDELLAGVRDEKILAQRALVAELDAELETVAIDLDKSTIKAPYPGIVSQRFLDEGAVAAAGAPVVSLIETGGLEARVGVPPHALDALPLGSAQSVEIGDKFYNARVKALLPELNNATRTAEVVLSLEAAADGELAGKLARIALSERVTERGFWLPTSALVKEPRGLWACFVLAPKHAGAPDTTGTVEQRNLEVLHVEDERVFVRGALANADRVVLGGAHRVVAGQMARAVETSMP